LPAHQLGCCLWVELVGRMLDQPSGAFSQTRTIQLPSTETFISSLSDTPTSRKGAAKQIDGNNQ